MSSSGPRCWGCSSWTPLLGVAYVALARRRERRRAELAGKAFVPSSSARPLRRLRHVPFAFFLLLSSAPVGIARPEVSAGLPRMEGTVSLAFDVSNSMMAEDLEPTAVGCRQGSRGRPSWRPAGLGPDRCRRVQRWWPGQRNHRRRPGGRPGGDQPAEPARRHLSRHGIFSSLNAIAGAPIALDDTRALQGSIDDVDIGYLGSAVVLLSDGEKHVRSDRSTWLSWRRRRRAHLPIGIGDPDGTGRDRRFSDGHGRCRGAADRDRLRH